MSIGYQTPSVVHIEQDLCKKMWKDKVYKEKTCVTPPKSIFLQKDINDPCNGICQHT